MKTGCSKRSRPVLGTAWKSKAQRTTHCARLWRLSDLLSGQVIAQSVSVQRSSINRPYSSSSWGRGKGGYRCKPCIVYRVALESANRARVQLGCRRCWCDAPTNSLSPPTWRWRFQSRAYITWKFISLTCLLGSSEGRKGAAAASRTCSKRSPQPVTDGWDAGDGLVKNSCWVKRCRGIKYSSDGRWFLVISHCLPVIWIIRAWQLWEGCSADPSGLFELGTVSTASGGT